MSTLTTRFARVWLGPVILGTVSGVALYAALVRDGFVDTVCGLLLCGVGMFGMAFVVRCRLRP